MRRPAARLARLLACAVVPATLVAGCSSGSPAPSAPTSAAAPASPSQGPPVRYAKLPGACAAIGSAAVKSLVPGAKKPSGTPADSGRPADRSGCSWSGLHGYQYRFLDDAYQRFDNVPQAQSGNELAQSAYSAAVRSSAKAAANAKAAVHTAPLPAVGDEAVLLTWDVTQDHAAYHYATVVARSANAVLTVDYSGAGLQGDTSPKAATVSLGAEQAAKAALAALH